MSELEESSTAATVQCLKDQLTSLNVEWQGLKELFRFANLDQELLTQEFYRDMGTMVMLYSYKFRECAREFLRLFRHDLSYNPHSIAATLLRPFVNLVARIIQFIELDLIPMFASSYQWKVDDLRFMHGLLMEIHGHLDQLQKTVNECKKQEIEL